MTERDLGQITVELALIQQNLNQLRENYLKQREEAVAPLLEKYTKQKRKLERQYEEYKKQLTVNVVAKLMNPGERIAPDSENYGYTTVEK